MPIAKAVVEKIATNGSVSARRDQKITASTVSRFGTRTVDQGFFSFPMGTDIDLNYNLKYIQDIVDVTDLSAIYNFQLTVNDESGYDMNPSADLPISRFINPNNSLNNKKFQAQYCLKFTKSSSTDFYEIPHNARLDMTKQFDLYIYCAWSNTLGSYTTDEKAIIFSKYDTTHGGIEVGFIHKSSGDKRLFVRTLASTGTPVEREGAGLGNTGFGNISPVLIRIKRDENNLVSCYLNGALEVQFTDTTSYGQSENIRIGAHQHPSSVTEKWAGLLFQMRLYTGVTLSDEESEIIQLSSPQPMTMKLAGKVWKINDNTNPKKVHVRGDGRMLLDTFLNSDVLSGTSTSPVNRTKNVYDANQDNDLIIQDIISNVNSSFQFKEPTSAANSTHVGKFIATGSFVQCVELLLLESDSLLFTNNKIVTVESTDGVTTPYKFEQGNVSSTPGYVITKSGKDDSLLVNAVELVGRLNNKYIEDPFTSGTNTVETLLGTPVDVKVESPIGTTLVENVGFTVDYVANTVTITGSHSAGKISYNYEDLDSLKALYFKNNTTGASSQTKYGLRNRRMFTPQYTVKEDMDQASQRIIGDNNEVLERYEVKAPTHVNNIRENHRVIVKNDKKGINTTSDTTASIVKSISWTFPNISTIIQLGEHRFNSFDLDKSNMSGISQASGNTYKTHNA
tara:strand:- start:57 stop:2093 length:2037 start_codon:yes stop_codon:yes gene_type:complete